jgi:hypothetical protein
MQKWEKEHFDPDRSFSSKKKAGKIKPTKTPAKSKRIG